MKIKHKSLQLHIFLCIFFSIFLTICSFAQQRFPHPEFETNYQFPKITAPEARLVLYQYLDVIVLALLLGIMTHFVIKKRSRKKIFWTSIFAIIYFGFWKKGCVCPIGAIQNISLGLADSHYGVSLVTLLIFVLPIFFALFFGRIYCSGVCFMGALQDLLIIKAFKLPGWFKTALETIPLLYLGFAVLFAATNTDFIICRYDPFIGFFRFSASFGMFIFGAIILICGLFIARPYCRFICPYGVLLKWTSYLSKWRVRISPAECVQCHLCANACPVDAIQIPNPDIKPEKNGPKKMLIAILIIPILMVTSGFLFSLLSKPLSIIHPTVKMAYRLETMQNNDNPDKDIYLSAFYSSGTSKEDIQTKALKIYDQLYFGLWILGMSFGFILSLGFIKLSIIKKTEIYEAERGECVACGRCYSFCPVDENNRKKTDVK